MIRGGRPGITHGAHIAAVGISVAALTLTGCQAGEPARPAVSDSLVGSTTHTAEPSPTESGVWPDSAGQASSPTSPSSASGSPVEGLLERVGRPRSGSDQGGDGPRWLRAVSGDEVWVNTYVPGEAPQWFRYTDEAWEPVNLVSGECAVVPATDGAVWVVTSEGLSRIAGTKSRVVTGDVRDIQNDVVACPELVAGPDGSMWLNRVGLHTGWDLQPSVSELVHYAADGTRTSIGKPKTMKEVCLEAAGADGSVWVSEWKDAEDEMSCDITGRDLARWDGGRWLSIEQPPEVLAEGWPMAGADDGALWARLGSFSGNALGRYSDGRWSVTQGGEGNNSVPGNGGIRALPGGRVCTASRTSAGLDSTSGEGFYSVDCFDAKGGFITNFTSSEAQAAVLAVSIAPDGAIWMVLADPESLAAQTHEFPPTADPLDWEIARLIEEPPSR